MKRIIFLFLFLFGTFISYSQTYITVPDYLRYSIDQNTSSNIFITIDSLLLQMNQGKLNYDFISEDQKDLTYSTLKNFQSYENNKSSVDSKIKDKQLINFYKIDDNKYLLSILYSKPSKNNLPILLNVLNLIASDDDDKITFAIPINYLTRYWKKTKVGNIMYHYIDTINVDRAMIFDKKNTIIAKKLGLKPGVFDFYMCANYQEILKLRGFEYSASKNGKTRSGYGVDANTIFSIMNNEDFSHDVFHFYSSLINKRENRNWIAEEGIAYSWGNAYYTDENGEMISQKRLVNRLKEYLNENENPKLLWVFAKNKRIFEDIAPDISVRSAIAGLIVEEVEKQKGIDGLLELINCGKKRKMDKFMEKINDLIGINQNNFNEEVKKLIVNYK